MLNSWPARLEIIAAFATVMLVAGSAVACGGSAKTTTAPPTTTAPKPGGDQVASGAHLFSDNCQSCHGFEGAGGHIGPNLQKSSVADNLARVETQIRHGGGAMPPFSGVLSAKEIDTVAHYVVEQIAPKQ